MAIKDLTGQRFGRLTVIEQDPEWYITPGTGKRQAKWICECDCGKKISVVRGSLTNGRTRSCGCLRADNNHSQEKNLAGMRFGHLVVESRDTPYVKPNGLLVSRWNCTCDCGNKVSVLQYELTGGRKTHCGCEKGFRVDAKDLTGQRFGRLFVVGPAELSKPDTYGQRLGWKCRCDCGKESIVTRSALIGGRTKSCGCLSVENGREQIVKKNVFGHFERTKICCIQPNRPPIKTNTSGVNGVQKYGDRWTATIGFQRNQIRLGTYATVEEAAAARRTAEEKYYVPTIERYEEEMREKEQDT